MGEWSEKSSSAVVALLDIDSFECQIWQRYYPEYKNTPCVVADSSGRIVSVTYEAKGYGISREMRTQEALNISRYLNFRLQIFWKPMVREKAETRTLRLTSWEILDTTVAYLEEYAPTVVIEYASNDEFYFDLTEEVTRRMESTSWIRNINFKPRTYLEGRNQKFSMNGLKYRVDNIYPTDIDKYATEQRLVYGAAIIQDICENLLNNTQFECSAGVGTNKLMAKLGCGFNKPKGITVFPHTALPRVSQRINLSDIPGFGGKQGDGVKTRLGISTMAELARIDQPQLENLYPDDPEFVWKLFSKSHGVCDEKVVKKLMKDEVSCSKSFFQGYDIFEESDLYKHVHYLGEELVERFDEEEIRHKRVSTTIKIIISYRDRRSGQSNNSSYTIQIHPNDDSEGISTRAFDAVVNELSIDVRSVKINKICLVAKNFQTVASCRS